MRKLLPVLLAVLGLGGGIGAGLLLRPAPEETAMADQDCPPIADDGGALVPAAAPPPEAAVPTEFVDFPNQFVIPLIADNSVSSMVVMSIGVEVDAGTTESVYAMQPRLRDAMLQVLFDHANAGGFDGNFMQREGLDNLRGALGETARRTLGEQVRGILITDLVKREV